FYSFRLYFLVFHGKERYDQNPDAHHDDHAAHDDHTAPDAHHATHDAHAAPAVHDDHGRHGHGDHKPHESPWVVTLPLVLLVVPSVLIGFFTMMPMLFGDFFKDAIFVDAAKHPAMAELSEMIHGPVAMALHSFYTAPLYLALAGVVLSWYMYMINPALPAAIKRKVQPIYTLLENKYYLDWFNENVLARGARVLGTGLWQAGDRKVIDGFFVNGSWKVVGWISGIVRKAQSGFIYHYAFGMIIGVFLLMTYFVWLK
ncbi:MAG: NADH-quinone oxidoreductase subunit L, partial [Alcaligenaceae bacterium]